MSAISRALSAVARRVVVQNLTRSPAQLMSRATGAMMQQRFQPTRFMSATKSEQELQEFLTSEIELEKESTKSMPQFKDWNVSHEGSEITLTKKFNSEEITIKANVCYSVEEEPSENEQDAAQMVCKPDFAIEIKKNGQILGLNCTFFQEEDQSAPPSDDIQINEISLYEGEFQKSNYAISADVIDGTLYDMLMNILEERGIDYDFAKKFIEYSTAYEHKQYVSLLGSLKKFFS